ncbi:MAG: tRNA (adenosine(37)-N6)-threonylcarbamoyltransferase complex ATPase subunit type 1 TsaE [Verrucomicrobia bacterium]|nr:tRNA (adenosine(37)-N6)-threonylcarbamoyltransferase complex ATPase subunit type 1 TsaE [Verrucomicrobiota bacterium]
MPVVITRSVGETEALGESLARSARAGDVFGLAGDLGAGKTAFARGFARGLGCPGRVHSPTFSLVNEHAGGRYPLFHLDLYRLDTLAAVEGAGLAEYLEHPNGVSLVEWIERWTGSGRRVRRVTFRVLDEESREITHDIAGA